MAKPPVKVEHSMAAPDQYWPELPLAVRTRLKKYLKDLGGEDGFAKFCYENIDSDCMIWLILTFFSLPILVKLELYTLCNQFHLISCKLPLNPQLFHKHVGQVIADGRKKLKQEGKELEKPADIIPRASLNTAWIEGEHAALQKQRQRNYIDLSVGASVPVPIPAQAPAPAAGHAEELRAILAGMISTDPFRSIMIHIRYNHTRGWVSRPPEAVK
jgi:hypothetical protein